METWSSLLPTAYAVAKRCIHDRSAHIGIVGLGPAGLRLSHLFASSGFAVEGFELGTEQAETAHPGQTHVHSIITEQISKAGDRGRIHIAADLSKISETEVIIICLPPCLDEEQNPDLRTLRETIFSIASNLHAGQLVVMESITYPGATDELVVPILESANGSHLKVSRNTGGLNDIFVGVSPERYDLAGRTIDQRDVPKVVSGVDWFGSELTADLYGKVFKRIVRVSSTATAEITRLLESTYQSVNIALAHEVKQVCLRMNIDAWEVIAAASTRPVGFQAFFPGPGVGGRHIPFDGFSLSRKAKAFGVRAKLIELAREINGDMPNFIVRAIGEAFNKLGKSVRGSDILVLGIAYEKDSDDLYESPSLTIIELLLQAGAHVEYNDPFVPYVGQGYRSDLNMTSTSIEDVSQYDAVLIITDHSAYDYPRIVSQAKLVIDTRNAIKGIAAENIVRC